LRVEHHRVERSSPFSIYHSQPPSLMIQSLRFLSSSYSVRDVISLFPRRKFYPPAQLFGYLRRADRPGSPFFPSPTKKDWRELPTKKEHPSLPLYFAHTGCGKSCSLFLRLREDSCDGAAFSPPPADTKLNGSPAFLPPLQSFLSSFPLGTGAICVKAASFLIFGKEEVSFPLSLLRYVEFKRSCWRRFFPRIGGGFVGGPLLSSERKHYLSSFLFMLHRGALVFFLPHHIESLAGPLAEEG